ncbi:MAG: tripartite tricarboxylate transporter TctB family protein [Pseudomonadota bacterium]
MRDDDDIHAKTRGSGQIVFVAGGLAITLLLLSQITGQTIWDDQAKNFAAQPRFWPLVALLAMVLGFALHLWRMRHRAFRPEDWGEARRWIEPAEYVVWFMGYVFLVPLIGFLPMSLVFATGLTWRLGYRNRRMLWTAALFAFATVVFFKALLGVKIPGSALYEMLPEPFRSSFILYF